jgi:hypothetical protein
MSTKKRTEPTILQEEDGIEVTATGGKQSRIAEAFELIEPDLMLRVAKVLADGREKYGAFNWKHIKDPEAHIGRAIRHLYLELARRRGEKVEDADHIANAVCRIMFAASVSEGK